MTMGANLPADPFALDDADDLPSSEAQSLKDIKVSCSNRFGDVEEQWHRLEELGVQTPSQSREFVRVWAETFDIAARDMRFVLAEKRGKPLALMVLHKQRLWGLNALVPFGAEHVGCHAPLVDRTALAAMSDDERRELWKTMTACVDGADLIYYADVPEFPGEEALFAGLGQSTSSEVLYRTEFTSWEDCDAQQRSRSRRKHDKQQGAKLAAMGAVSFEEIDSGADASFALTKMFEQRAERFAQQGIEDPFESAKVRAFYRSVFDQGERLRGKLHVLRLNGEIVATRYNLVYGQRMFCLISSMDTRPELSPGSPGKQIMVWLMQTIFAQGISSFDMGAGFSDEKRHWCNVHIPLGHHYVPLSQKGRVIANLHRQLKKLKGQIKSNDALFGALKTLRTKMRGGADRAPQHDANNKAA